MAARAVGAPAARALWLLLWGSMAYFAVQPANRAPQAMASTVSAMTAGEPGWLRAIGHGAATLLAGQGLLASALLAAAYWPAAAIPDRAPDETETRGRGWPDRLGSRTASPR